MGIFDSASEQKLPWQDEASQQAEERLMKEEKIQIPWHYNDTFGEDFKVLALRAGGFGAVFFVQSTRFGERIYAAKTLQRFLKNDYLGLPAYEQERIAKDFLEEALPWLEMGQHPNIVPVHLLQNIIHPATRRNVPFVFSEFMERGDLRRLVIEKGKLSLEETFSVGLQICEGLLHAYKHISAHKDLKPENIMVYRDGIYKVTDFSAGVMGTPGYMAPEQVAVSLKIEKKQIDHHADQFAIGLIMHDVFKGGDTQNEQIKRVEYIRSDPRRFIKEGIKEVLSNDIPTSLKAIIARCLQPRKEDRFADVSELKKELLKVYKAEFKKEYRFPEVEIDDSPEWWFNRGWAFYNIGRYAGAEIPYKEALRRLALLGADIDQAICIMNMGFVYQNTGKFSEAEANYKEALKMFKAIPGTEREQARCIMNMGFVYQSTGRFYEAEANHKEALGMYKAIPGTEREQAGCLTNLGAVYQSTGRFSEAEANHKEALGMYKAIPGTEREQASCIMNMGIVYWSTSRFYEAKANYKEALKMFKAIPGTEREQARCIMNLGAVYLNTDKFYEAEANYKEALRMFKAILGAEIEQAGCLTNLGAIYQSTGRFSEAEANHKEALGMYKAIPGTEIEQASCIMNMGIVYWSTSRFYEAEANYKEALKMFKAIPGTEREQASCIMNLGAVYLNTDKFYEAEANHKEALGMYKAIPGTEREQARCIMNLGAIYQSTGRFSEAEANYREVLKMYKPIPGTEIEQATCLMNLGILYSKLQESSKARSTLKEALEICKRYPTGTERIKNTCLQRLSKIP